MPTCLPIANTQTGLITIHCAAKLSAQCKMHLLVLFSPRPVLQLSVKYLCTLNLSVIIALQAGLINHLMNKLAHLNDEIPR